MSNNGSWCFLPGHQSASNDPWSFTQQPPPPTVPPPAPPPPPPVPEPVSPVPEPVSPIPTLVPPVPTPVLPVPATVPPVPTPVPPVQVQVPTAQAQEPPVLAPVLPVPTTVPLVPAPVPPVPAAIPSVPAPVPPVPAPVSPAPAPVPPVPAPVPPVPAPVPPVPAPVPPVPPNAFMHSVPSNNWQNNGSPGNSLLPTSSPGNSLIPTPNLNVPVDGKDSKNPSIFPAAGIQFSVPPPNVVPLNVPPPRIFPPSFPSINPNGLPSKNPILQNVPTFIPPPAVRPSMSLFNSYQSPISTHETPVTIPVSSANTYVASNASSLEPFTYPTPTNRFNYYNARNCDNHDLIKIQTCDNLSTDGELTDSDADECNENGDKNNDPHSERYENNNSKRKHEKSPEKHKHDSNHRRERTSHKDKHNRRDRTPHKDKHRASKKHKSDRSNSSRRSKSLNRKSKSLHQKLKSPHRKLKSPCQESISFRQKSNSPCPKSKSPHPISKSPPRKSKSPRQRLTSPHQASTSPPRKRQSPDHSNESQKTSPVTVKQSSQRRRRSRSPENEKSRRASEREESIEKLRKKSREKSREKLRAKSIEESREKSRAKSIEESRDKSREKSRARSREKSRARSRETSRVKSREKSRAKSREKSREKSRAKSREKSRAKCRAKLIEELRDKSREMSRPRSREKSTEKSRDKSREQSRARSREKSGARSRETSKARSRETSRARSREKSRARSREKSRARSREKSRAKSIEKSREKSRAKSREKSREKSRAKSIEELRDKSREKSRAKSIEQSREMSRARSREKSRDKSREQSRARSREQSRARSREQSRARSREKSRAKSREKSRAKSREKSRAKSREKSRAKSRAKSMENSITKLREKSIKQLREKSMAKLREKSMAKLREKSKTKSRVKIQRSRIRASRARESSPVKKILQSLLTKTYESICSSSSEKYYIKNEGSKEVTATDALVELHARFKDELVDRAEKARASKPKYEPPARKTKLRKPKPPKNDSDSESSSSSEQSSSEDEDTAMEELEKKRKHPHRLHHELWYNDPKEMNDGPLCRCSAKARRSGIRHGIYAGEGHLPLCNPISNNANRLHHYRITMSPHTNFLTSSPTIIFHEGKQYVFEGFSMFSHKPLPKLPNCKVIRFNYEYTILYLEEEGPINFTVQGLELFSKFLIEEILELVDLNWKAHDDPDGCPRFHFLPRFAREVDGCKKELLSLNVVLQYLLDANKILVDEAKLPEVLAKSSLEWQDVADEVKGMIVTCPGMKPSSIRVDQLDREQCESKTSDFPVIVHFGVRPPQLSYAGNPLYQKAWRDYVKFRHLLANKPKVKYGDRHLLGKKEMKLQEMRMENDLKRDVTVVISSQGFYKTGIMSDIIQHAMLLPVLVCHLRFHDSLSHLEDKIGYHFRDRFLLQLALTHPSYRENFGTNPDHARNSLTNCGLRQPQYGDRRIHYMNTRKRGINTLINIMSRFGSQKESTSCINHNERLEFLGDAVVEFLSSIHLFYMFPDLEEGGLATYRAAIVQNQHLAILAKKLQLEKFMLYAHGSDLCHDLELRHAMANCFEALMGALFLDNGIEVADKVFSITLFSEPELLAVWKNYPLHPLQEQEPGGDRRWIKSVPLLQKLHKFEETIGIEFTHIRLLARSLTHRSLGYNNLTLGSNQRLEFLGDTVLQLVASEYLYKFFPEHHEGHLSLLRSSLVNNRTQAVVCQDLGMVEYAIYPYDKVELKSKDKADLLEAFLGALYVDKDLGYCRKFCEVCFFPRLQDFIMNQDWNDPKSKLQQCCLTLRSMDGGEPDIPTYKVIECKGPTNTRVYSVAVYFQGNRLAVGSGHSIQQAEMDAAGNALRKSKGLFPQLKHQRRAIERSLKQGHRSKTPGSSRHKSKSKSLS